MGDKSHSLLALVDVLDVDWEPQVRDQAFLCRQRHPTMDPQASYGGHHGVVAYVPKPPRSVPGEDNAILVLNVVKKKQQAGWGDYGKDKGHRGRLESIFSEVSSILLIRASRRKLMYV
jgi:hypothetical protein